MFLLNNGRPVDRCVCHNFLKEREVTVPCSNRSSCSRYGRPCEVGAVLKELVDGVRLVLHARKHQGRAPILVLERKNTLVIVLKFDFFRATSHWMKF